MNPSKVRREQVRILTDLPNIGPAMVEDLHLLGIQEPADLQGQDAYLMYDELCRLTGVRHDPCVLDTFISIVRFIEGEAPRPWWDYTAERKQTLRLRQANH
jgi:hypothetical protein